MIKRLKDWWKNYFWMTCSKCKNKMKNYTMQALVMTKDGARDRFYCKDCAIKIRGELLIEPLE